MFIRVLIKLCHTKRERKVEISVGKRLKKIIKDKTNCMTYFVASSSWSYHFALCQSNLYAPHENVIHKNFISFLEAYKRVNKSYFYCYISIIACIDQIDVYVTLFSFQPFQITFLCFSFFNEQTLENMCACAYSVHFSFPWILIYFFVEFTLFFLNYLY